MPFTKSFINTRIELVNSNDNKEGVEDVVFLVELNSGEIGETSIYLVPRPEYKTLAEKKNDTKRILNSIIDKSFFQDNSIQLKENCVALFFSFDLANLIDTCYVINRQEQSLRTILTGLDYKRIVDITKQFNEKSEAHSSKKPYYLFFDTETTGLPRNWKAPVTDVNNWPRMVQIAWTLCDKEGDRIEFKDFIIRPESYSIPVEASNVHRITTERAFKEGEYLEFVLIEFNKAVEKADFIVAHNISFDEKILGAELIRLNLSSSFSTRRKICTMKSSTDYCAIPGPYGYKWPKLSELHIKLFGVDFDEAHDASVDINATEKCFWKMKEMGLV